MYKRQEALGAATDHAVAVVLAVHVAPEASVPLAAAAAEVLLAAAVLGAVREAAVEAAGLSM